MLSLLPVPSRPRQADRNIGFPRLLQAIVSAELVPIIIVLVLKYFSKFVLASREEFVERQMRSDNIKAAETKRQKEAMLVSKRRQREEAKLNPNSLATSFSRRSRSRPKTAPENAASKTTPISRTHEPNILTLDGGREGDEESAQTPVPDETGANTLRRTQTTA